jgi:hypothetical protein
VPDRDVSDREPPEERPVLTGLVALVGVTLAVGLVLGLTALAGTRILGLGGEDASAESSGGASMYLPKPERTTAPDDPLITLDSTPTEEETEESEPSEPKTSKKEDEEISLSASQTEVSSMEQIDLTGVYPGGEGAVLQVERFTGGSWTDFPVTVSVSDETFSTYVQTSQGGVNRFRVVDTDTGLISNEVRIRIS